MLLRVATRFYTVVASHTPLANYHFQEQSTSMYSSPTNKPPAVRRHMVYFIPEGDITIKVDDTVFRIHRYFLIKESKHFRSMLIPAIPCRDPPGSSETNPVVLEDAESEAFADLLWVFYNPKYSIYTATVDKWKRILNLAQQWSFIEVEKLCVRELEALSIPPIEKIRLYQDFKLDPNLLHDSFVALTIRDQPLDMEEGEQLKLATSLKIAQARELARRAPDGPATARLQDSEVQSVVKDIFRLGSASALTNPPPQPTAGARQNPTSGDDHVDKATAKNRKSASKTIVSSIITEGNMRSQTNRSHHFIRLGAVSPTLCLVVFVICYFH